MQTTICLNELVRTLHTRLFTGVVKVIFYNGTLTVENIIDGKVMFGIHATADKAEYYNRDPGMVPILPGTYRVRFSKGVVIHCSEYVEGRGVRVFRTFDDLAIMLKSGVYKFGCRST